MSYGEPPPGPPPGGPPPGPPPGGPPPGSSPFSSPGTAPGPPPVAAIPGVEPDRDARMWAMFCHLSALVLAVFGPLIIWLIKKEEYPFVERHGREALNFQLTLLIVQLICIPLVFLFCIGFVLIIGAGIYALVMSIIAALKANEGLEYTYPLSFRMIK